MIASPVAALIVGAGPAGLVLAVELARRGVAMHIIDAAPGPSMASRAKGLQPRTLEIFDDLGVIDQVVAGGAKFPRWRSYQGTSLKWEKSVYDMLGIAEPQPTADRPFVQTWMIPQWRTERIVRERLHSLGVEVEFGCTLTDLQQDAGGVDATLSTATGQEHLRCRYLIGADGARSAVRKMLGITFRGETSADEHYILADVRAEALEKTRWLNWAVEGNPARRISMCPLPHSDYFQFVAPLAADERDLELSLATVQRLFDERAGWPGVALSDLRWIARHRPNARLADRFRDGSVFLVGDAAHSPPTSPGQGLNISVQDAYNIGWKLAAVLSGAPRSLLDSYEEERRPIAAGVLGVLAQELEAQGTEAAAAKASQDQIRRDVFNLTHTYRGRTLAFEMRERPGPVQAGDRAPDAMVTTTDGETRRLFDLLRGPHVTALWLNAQRLSATQIERDPLFGVLRTHVLLPPIGRDAAADIHQIYGIALDGPPVLVLIRPDGYVGLCADRNHEAHVHRALGLFLGPAVSRSE